MDTAHPSFTVEVVSIADGAEVQFSNMWRQADGREDEWLNNYGMLIAAPVEDDFVLRCSDGYGLALNQAFDDLVVRIRLVRAL